MENRPLWVWAFIVGVLIGSKFIYRWGFDKTISKLALRRKKQDERKKVLIQ